MPAKPHKPFIFTIVTPSFNQGQYLADTIDSVLTQKGNFYIDYIIMDGGSTDNSVKVIRKFEKLLKDSGIAKRINQLTFYSPNKQSNNIISCLGISFRWVSKKDNGQVDALKQGFAKAKGDILNWINSDDYFTSKNVLATVAGYIHKDPDLKIITADGLFVTKEGKTIGTHHVSRLNFTELLYLDYHILQPSTFVKSEIHRNEYLNENYNCAFDGDYFIHLLSKNHKYLKTNDILSAFRFYEDNKTLSLAPTRYKENLRIGWTYDKNIIHFTVSVIYRFFEILIKPKTSNPLFFRFFNRLQNTAYRLLINENYSDRI